VYCSNCARVWKTQGRQAQPSYYGSGKTRKREKYKVFDDQIRTPTYVEDLTLAIGTIIEKKLRGIFHISGKDMLTPFEMAQMTARHVGLPESLLHPVTSGTFEQPPRRPSKTGFTITKAEKALLFMPTSFGEGLGKTFLEYNAPELLLRM